MCDRNCLHVRVNGECGVGEDPKYCMMFVDLDEYEAHVDKLKAEEEANNTEKEVDIDDTYEFDCHHCLYPSDENCAQCYGDTPVYKNDLPF